MLPFSVQLKPGEPTHEQIIAAVRTALTTGQLRDGDPFPSIREMTQELRISPSAAQKAVSRLREEGFLAQQAGSGFMVRLDPTPSLKPSQAADEIPTEIEVSHGAAIDPAFPFLAAERGVDGDGPLGTMAHYEIRRLIARGGMGMVFEAFDQSLHRHVAVKVLAPHLAVSPKARARFLREARAVAAVDHENVLPVHAVGESGGFPYLVMPLVKGQSLQSRLKKEGMLPIEEILSLGIKITRGLAAAHAQGLIHRDIKPDNVLLETAPGDRVWLADFGLARACEDQDLTGTGVVAGTPRFASPEQAEGRELDHRSDLFSLGSLLYTMATGCGPFDDGTVVAILRRIVDEQPVPPRAKRDDLPVELENLILRLLEKRPEDRMASARETVGLLEAAASEANDR